MQPIAEAFASVKLGAPAQFQNLTLIPLLAAQDRAPDYLLLDDALERKLARISEVSEAGSVPELMFVNEAPEKVLLIDGEELVGARQNRILNVTVLVGAHRQIRIPVSCVEQGRWRYQSRHFESAEHALFARARAKKMQHVSASLRECGERSSDQGEIWSDISAKAAYLNCESPTGSMSDIFDQQQARIEGYVKAFEPQPQQAGALFAINGKVVGLELFDSAATFSRFLAKLLRSYAMDAIEEPQNDAQPPVEQVVRKFLDDMQTAALERFPALGEGEDLRIESGAVAGGALFADNRIVHLCAFQIGKSDAHPVGRGGAIDFEVPAFLRRGFRRP